MCFICTKFHIRTIYFSILVSTWENLRTRMCKLQVTPAGDKFLKETTRDWEQKSG